MRGKQEDKFKEETERAIKELKQRVEALERLAAKHSHAPLYFARGLRNE
ncbi:hypothetical protein LCGC14_2534030 [marine sediment metagenome]|uniref:Uncharacterized protein n=1 Tax=marine sediment metagenome TaxID=412755 RepID=A0A0F9BFK4_9ZZZZ